MRSALMERKVTDDAHQSRCVDCRAEPPSSSGEITLVSKLGWRLTRRMDSRGQVVHDWRCPECAERHRRLRALAGMTSGFHRPVGVPEKKD